MLKLNTRMGIYSRRYYVCVNDKGYYVEDIVFYYDGKPLVSSGKGWVENAERCNIWNIELPIDTIKLKRKEVFNTRDVYILSNGKDSHGELTAVLYIPADMLNIKFAENVLRSYGVFERYTGNYGIVLEKCIKVVDGKLNELFEEYEQAHRNVDVYNMSLQKAELVLANIDKLKAIAEAYKEEKKRLHFLTVEDALKEDGQC